MYIWNTKKLITDFKNNNVSEGEKLKYFMIPAVLTMVAIGLFLYFPAIFNAIFNLTILDAVDWSLVSVIFTIATIMIYRANKQGDNQDFLARYICLSFPLIIKMLVLYTIVIFVYYAIGFVVAYEAFDAFTSTTNFVNLILTVVLEIIFYGLLYKAVVNVSQKN